MSISLRKAYSYEKRVKLTSLESQILAQTFQFFSINFSQNHIWFVVKPSNRIKNQSETLLEVTIDKSHIVTIGERLYGESIERHYVSQMRFV